MIFKEIEAFNNGDRDTILILRESLKDIRVPRLYRYVGELGVLVTRTPQTFKSFFALMKEINEDYALGIVLGYPPRCVEWFANATEAERRACPGFVFKTFSFKCPTELKDYAAEFYRKIEVVK